MVAAPIRGSGISMVDRSYDGKIPALLVFLVEKANQPRRKARFENFELDLRSGELRRDGEQAVQLSEQPFRILAMLLAVSGVPEIVAVLLELDPILRPWGSTPVDTDQLKGPTPPAAAMVWVYAAPIVPSGKVVVVIDRAGGGAALFPPQLVMEKPQAKATATQAKETRHWNLKEMDAVRIGSPLGKGWCETDTDEWSSSTAALVGCVNNINVRRATHVFLLCSFLALPPETIGSALGLPKTNPQLKPQPLPRST